MDFGSNSVLESVAFGLKCVLHRVRVSKCLPSRVIQNPAEQPPPQVFLSPPVLMHGGLLCIAFCLSVRLWEKCLEINSYLWNRLKGAGTEVAISRYPDFKMTISLLSTSISNTVNQFNLTAVKFSFWKIQTYLAQENLAFWKWNV